MRQLESYQDLEVWKQSKDLVAAIYQVTKAFPRSEQFGLVNQLRRACISIPSNLAEGCGRNYFKDSIQFFFVSRGSLYEIETQIIISFELGYINKDEQTAILEKIKACKRLLNGFINYYRNRCNDRPSTANEALEEYKLPSTKN